MRELVPRLFPSPLRFDAREAAVISCRVLTLEPPLNKHLLILLAAVLLGMGCSHPAPPSFSTEPRPLPNPSFTRQWATSLRAGGSDPVTAVHVSDSFVFAYRRDGSVSVMDRATGRLLHVDHPREAAQRIHPPVVLKDRIVYPTTTYLEVYDFAGRYIPHATKVSDELDKPFSQALNVPIRSDAVGAGKQLFFGADFPVAGRAVAIDMTRPYVPEFWTLMTPGSSVSGAPALLKDVVYVAADNGKIAAVATDSREPIWPLEQGVFLTYGGVVANLAADQMGVYVASLDTKLYCLQRASGKVRWQYFAGTPLKEGPVLTKDMIYQMVPGQGLAAIDKNPAAGSKNSGTNRDARWTAGDAAAFASEDDNYTYVRTFGNQIAAIDKKTGRQRFVSNRNDLVAFATNTKGDGMIYVATAAGRIMAVRAVLHPGEVGELVLVPAAPEPIAAAR
jgi:outer membrane protein assembly factor BamB